MKKLVLTVAVVMFWGAWASMAAAQDERFYTPDRDQVSLLKKGARASGKGKHAKAIRYYRAALAVGAFNMAHLSLGRALQKTGDCQGALAQFEAARTARAIQVPPPDQVNAKLDTYLTELKQTCPGTLAVACSPADIALTLNDEPIGCDEPVERPPGTWTLVGTLDGETRRQEVEIAALERTDIDLTIDPPTKTDPPPRVDLDAYPKAIIVPEPAVEDPPGGGPEAPTSTQRIAGWSLIGGGGALLISGGIFTALVADQSEASEALGQQRVIDPVRAQEIRDEGDLYFALQIAGYTLGAASLVTGAALLYFDEPTEAPPTSWRLRPWLGAQSAGASINVGF